MSSLKPLKKFVYTLSSMLNVVGVALILIMVVLIVADILSRLLFNIALQGSYELVEYIMGLMIVFAMGYCQVKNGHISVTSLVERLPKRAQAWADVLVNFVGLIMFGIITWQTFVKAGMDMASGTTSAVLYIPKYPFMYMVGFGFALLTLVYLVQILVPDEPEEKKPEEEALIA